MACRCTFLLPNRRCSVLAQRQPHGPDHCDAYDFCTVNRWRVLEADMRSGHGSRTTPIQVHDDPYPDLLGEPGPDSRGVGPWVPCDKPRLLSHHLDATRHAWRRWGHQVFIDPLTDLDGFRCVGKRSPADGESVVASRAAV